MTICRISFVLGLLFAANGPPTAMSAKPPYRDSRLPTEDRVKDLVARMTVEEKVAQLVCTAYMDYVGGEHPRAPASLETKFKGLSWGVLDSEFGASCGEFARRIRACQDYARRKTRLGIPFLSFDETLHGVLATGATIFPQAIAQGATWNPELVKEMASVIAKEGAAMGLTQSLSPMLELARDPRWGRVEECFGECPCLVARMVVAYIQGMQGEDARRELAADKMLCMSKVMAGYCVPQGGINLSPASLGERELRSVYFRP